MYSMLALVAFKRLSGASSYFRHHVACQKTDLDRYLENFFRIFTMSFFLFPHFILFHIFTFSFFYFFVYVYFSFLFF